jgi:hypothetical protein
MKSKLKVVGENRTLPVINGVFTDTFTKYEVHAYRFVTGMVDTAPQPLTGLNIAQ